MEPLIESKRTPAQIVAELREVGLPEVREFLSVIFSNYTKSGEWQQAPEEWQQTCNVYYLELSRALELMEQAVYLQD